MSRTFTKKKMTLDDIQNLWRDPTPEELGFDKEYFDKSKARELFFDVNKIPWLDVTNETFGLDKSDPSDYEYVPDDTKKPFDLEEFLANCKSPTPEELGFKENDESYKPKKPFNLDDVLNFPDPTPEQLGFGKWDESEKELEKSAYRNPFSISNSVSMIQDHPYARTDPDVFYKHPNGETKNESRPYSTHQEPFFNPNVTPK